MEIQIGKGVLELVEGDITRQDTEAIVNAANSGLRGGGGVDGAIHRAGGPEIMEECRKYDGCPTGKAVITTGGKLKAKYVIHTVGPRFTGEKEDPELLASAYRSSLSLASKKKIRSLAFPSISTGIYGYPIDKASRIALSTAKDYLEEHPGDIDLVRFVLFSRTDFEVYCKALEDLCG